MRPTCAGKLAGARVDVDIAQFKKLSVLGAEGRWRNEIQQRRKEGLPSNVYIANARSIEYAIGKGRPAPNVRYVGRIKHHITEIYDTVDEVVDALARNDFRTEFSRGRYAKKPR